MIYAGELYETDPNININKVHRDCSKLQRDNAPIVKTVHGGVMDIIMKYKSRHRKSINLFNKEL